MKFYPLIFTLLLITGLRVDQRGEVASMIEQAKRNLLIEQKHTTNYCREVGECLGKPTEVIITEQGTYLCVLKNTNTAVSCDNAN